MKTKQQKQQAELVKKQTSNAIKWINALDPSKGFQKTTEQLGKKFSGVEYVKNIKKDMAYCCLGVACRTMEYPNVKFNDGERPSLVKDLGLFDSVGGFYDDSNKVYNGFRSYLKIGKEREVSSLVLMNDNGYTNDKDFTRVHKFILKNLKYIFVPEVAERLKKHYSKKK